MLSNFKVYKATVKEKEGISSCIKSHLLRYTEISFAYLYGSFVDKEIDFFRDIDVGIYVKDYREEDWKKYELGLASDLEKHINYSYPVDVRVINGSDIFYVQNVIQGEILFIRDEDLWADFVVFISKLYGDIGQRIIHYKKEAIFY